MNVPMTLLVTGAKPVDFETYQYIKVSALMGIKNGVGSATKELKFFDLNQYDKFKHIKEGEIYPANAEVSFEDNPKGGVDIVIHKIDFAKKGVSNG